MFNPNEHMMTLKGNKQYLQVAWRLVWFREEHPDWSLDTQALEMAEDHAIFRAVICDADGRQLSCGHGSESKRDFMDFIEKAETKAVGRALAMLGYGTQFAGEEFDEGERIVDTPLKLKKKEEPGEEGPAEDEVTAGTVLELPKRDDFNAYRQISLWCIEHGGLQMGQFVEMRTRAINAGLVQDIPCKELTPEQYAELIGAIEPMLKGENK